uniref:NADH-ubiquinone oxidoreductase chain 6 n=1 Tax=Calotes emma TaxID=52214 RepID=A0A8F7CBR2_9SAUR|nr:NADH dehydrogenase subunit 6 [Calotes emma]
MYFVLLLSLGFFCGVVGVVSNPSSCFAAGALMVSAGFGCGILAEVGSFFLALVLYLVYLGGMLVVFAYSVALSSDVYPEAWGEVFENSPVLWYYLFVSVWLFCGLMAADGYQYFSVGGVGFESGFGGVSLLYGVGGWNLIIVGVGLLMTLFIVLELVRGVSFSIFKD